MDKNEVKKTAVCTPFGLIEFLYTPFGLKNATETFQRFMDQIFRGLDFVFCYKDDILIASSSREEHEHHLLKIFSILRQHGLSLNASKCQFSKSEVSFFGHLISSDDVKPPEDHISAVVNYKLPVMMCELGRFLGIINYYRRCIPHAAQLQATLNDLIKGIKKNDKRKVPWTQDTISAFEKCKRKIADAALLSHFPNPDAKLNLVCDASDIAIRAVIEQLSSDSWVPLGFFSRKLSPAEKKYSTYDRELLAIYDAFRHFKHLLEGRVFVIKTDH